LKNKSGNVFGRKRETTHIRVWKTDHTRLKEIREHTGLENMAWVVHRLLQKQGRNLATVEAIMKDRTPIVVTGEPESGKTFFIKNRLLPTLKDNPVLVVDA
jgi:hypothetical protein